MKIKYNKDLVCPLCGSTDVQVCQSYEDGTLYIYEVHCNKCCADWHQDHEMLFIGVSCVTDKDGKEYEWENVEVQND